MSPAGYGGAEGGGGGGGAPPPAVIAVRSNFNPLAAFEPSLVTDANGQGVVRFTVPDNLTSYRVWAIAVHGNNRFGHTESSISARLPLMLRPSAPR